VIIHPLLIIWQGDWIPKLGWFMEITWNNSCITATSNDHKWPPWKIYTTFCCKYFHDVFGWFWASPFFGKVCAVWFQTAKTAGLKLAIHKTRDRMPVRCRPLGQFLNGSCCAYADLTQVLMYKAQYIICIQYTIACYLYMIVTMYIYLYLNLCTLFQFL